jgi:hypothetical protein
MNNNRSCFVLVHAKIVSIPHQIDVYLKSTETKEPFEPEDPPRSSAHSFKLAGKLPKLNNVEQCLVTAMHPS